MKIRFITSVAGYDFAHKVDDEVELPADLAKRHVAAGNAVEIAPPEPVELTRKTVGKTIKKVIA